MKVSGQLKMERNEIKVRKIVGVATVKDIREKGLLEASDIKFLESYKVEQ